MTFGQFLHYARRVRLAEYYMRSRLEQCRDAGEDGPHLGVGDDGSEAP